MNNEKLILEHYRKQAELHGKEASSTMPDNIVREKEQALILSFIRIIGRSSTSILDIGCGNGFTVGHLLKQMPDNIYTGLDFTPELIDIANDRNIKAKFLQGSIKETAFEDDAFDLIYTERCLINILDWDEQKKALKEIHRILKPNGHFLMIECFNDGQHNYNKARRELGLDEIPPAYHNLYFNKRELFDFVKPIFDIVKPYEFFPEAEYLFPQNFLSSHYFISRVLQPALMKGEWVRNSEISKFFSFIEPQGNYSPIQAIIFRKQ